MSNLEEQIDALRAEVKKLRREISELTQIRQLLLAETVRLRRLVEYYAEK